MEKASCDFLKSISIVVFMVIYHIHLTLLFDSSIALNIISNIIIYKFQLTTQQVSIADRWLLNIPVYMIISWIG